MSDFSFGQPDGGVIQIAYSVADIDQAMADYGARLNVGPWFTMGPFNPPAARYKDEPCGFVLSLAFAYSGHVQIELLQQHNDAPSALRNRPLGFNHWGVGVRDFDAALARHAALGHAIVFTDLAPDGGRFAYLDTTDTLPGYIELIEMNPERDGMFGMMHQASIGWDGSDPVRRIGPA